MQKTTEGEKASLSGFPIEDFENDGKGRNSRMVQNYKGVNSLLSFPFCLCGERVVCDASSPVIARVVCSYPVAIPLLVVIASSSYQYVVISFLKSRSPRSACGLPRDDNK